MTEVKKEGVLSLVLPENTKVSGKSINIEETVSHRSLEKGTMDSYAGTDWYQKVLFYQYLVNYLGNYVEKSRIAYWNMSWSMFWAEKEMTWII